MKMKIFKSLKRFSIWLFGFKCKEGIVSKDEFYNIRNFLFDQNKLIINPINFPDYEKGIGNIIFESNHTNKEQLISSLNTILNPKIKNNTIIKRLMGLNNRYSSYKYLEQYLAVLVYEKYSTNINFIQDYECYKIAVSKLSRQGKFFGSGIIENLIGLICYIITLLIILKIIK